MGFGYGKDVESKDLRVEGSGKSSELGWRWGIDFLSVVFEATGVDPVIRERWEGTGVGEYWH